ncbi:hypothetical protein MMC22_002207 [Lobaria immixta]|nr:hypothetical protein [Lobaria immixta]
MHINLSNILGAAATVNSLLNTWYSGSGITLDNSLSTGSKQRRTDVAPGIELRIMPLGASITYGTGSSDGNGYRLPLAEKLAGTKLRFIGSVQSGDMSDNYNEGHPGAVISEIANFARASLGDRPNVILLHVGTNDLASDEPLEKIEDAPERLGGLIDELVSVCPDATILVAQLIHAQNPLYENRIQKFNTQVPEVVAKRANASSRVMVADMRPITKEYLTDGIHPTDVGYKMMGDIWFNGIQAAYAKGWIEPPIGPDPPEVVSNENRVAQKAITKKRQSHKERPRSFRS